MDEETLLNQLEELAGKLGIKVRYGKIGVEESHRPGRLCRLKGEYVLIIHSRLSIKEKIGMIAKTLKGLDTGDVYVLPIIRELLDQSAKRTEKT